MTYVLNPHHPIAKKLLAADLRKEKAERLRILSGPVVLRIDVCANPDFGETAPPARSISAGFTSARHAIAHAMAYRDQHGLGGGNWRAALYRDDKKLADLSYNGRLWSAATGREVTE